MDRLEGARPLPIGGIHILIEQKIQFYGLEEYALV